MTKQRHSLALTLLVPYLVLAACAGAEADDTARSYATVTDAPTPDYSAAATPIQRDAVSEIERFATSPAPPDARAIGDLWLGRLEAHGALMGSGRAGKEPDDPVSQIDTLLTAREFDAWVAENGWQAPAHITWRFQDELTFPRITAAAEQRVRVWPASERRTGWQLEALESGRVVLRDGCFFVIGHDGGEKLAWFHAETGLAIDPQGYLVLVDRATGETRARVGEHMSWAGPNEAPQQGEAVAALRAACGQGEVHGVGNSESSERFMTRYPHLRDNTPPPAPVAAAD